MPKITIITINFNNIYGLKKTIESAVSQSLTDFEYIIIDGGSIDGSTEIIKHYSDKLSWWVSEPDRGIYHAMNKGILKSTGDYILFLNSGDYFCSDNTLESCKSFIDGSCDFYSGNLFLVSSGQRKLLSPVKEISLYYCVYEGLTHPNTFIRRSLYDRFGLYNEENKIVSDWEFFLIALGLNNASYKPLDVDVACFIRDGVSSGTDNSAIAEETRNAVSRHIPGSILIDLERLHYLEGKMNQAHYRGLEYLEKYPRTAAFILLPLRIMNFLQKKSGYKYILKKS
jgi:glycosyltransferase involved in cell wall biosynthesis